MTSRGRMGSRCFSFAGSPASPGSFPQSSLQSSAEQPPNPVLAAQREGRLAFSFSGGGFLLPYFVGVVKGLESLGLLSPTTHFAGASAGSLIAASVGAGIPIDTVLQNFLDTSRDCRAHGTQGRLSSALLASLEATLPADAHASCSGRTHVGITRVKPFYLRHKTLSAFDGRRELIAALLASCHLPRYSNGEWTTTLTNGKRVFDGGFTNILPVPAGTHHHFVKVACFPLAILERLPLLNKKHAMAGLMSHGIYPDGDDPSQWPWSLQETLTYALAPHPGTDNAFVSQLVELGALNTMAWAVRHGLSAEGGGLVGSSMTNIGNMPSASPSLRVGGGAGVVVAAAAAEGAEAGAERAAEEQRRREEGGGGGEPAALAVGAAVAAAAEAHATEELARQLAREVQKKVAA